MKAIKEVETERQQDGDGYQECRCIQAEESPDSLSFELRALHNYRLDHVSSIFGLVGRRLQHFV